MSQDRTGSFRPLRLSLVFALVFAELLGLAVAVIMSIPVEPYFPPESLEITAMRLSPENGFYALMRAEKLIDLSGLGPGIPAWGKMQEVLETGWPDDTERESELLRFVDQAAPAIAEIRKALEEYYLQPEISFEAQVPSLIKSKTMAQVLAVQEEGGIG